MNKRAAVLLILALIALPGLASAQRTVAKAQVPFDFIANGRIISAGPCTVVDQQRALPVLVIRNGNESALSLVKTNRSSKPADKTVLVFHRYGKQYFLSSIRVEGQEYGYELPVSKAELELRAQKVTERDETLAANVK